MKLEGIMQYQNQTTIHFFSDNLLAIERESIYILINKPVIINLSILEISEIVVFKF